MPNRTTLVAIAAVLAIPLIFAALGGGRSAGLLAGVLLVTIGLGWSAIGSRGRRDEP